MCVCIIKVIIGLGAQKLNSGEMYYILRAEDKT